jgi:hypothetical protein
MKIFILKLIYFFSPIIVILIIIELGLSSANNSYTEKKKYFEKQLGDIQILVMGSSHSLFGINPEYFDELGFNLSNVSQSLFYDKELIFKYIDHLPKLKMIIIPISYFSLYYSLNDKNAESWRAFFYYQFWGIKIDYKQFSFKKYSKIALYGIKESLKITLKLFNNKLDYSIMKNGFQPMNSQDSNCFDIKSIKNRISFYNSLIDEDNLFENKKHLEDLLSIIKENIQIYFITLPVYKKHYELLNKKILKNNEFILKSLCKQQRCKYLNYLCDERFSLEDFRDADHLNLNGAKKISKILNLDIKRLL